MIEEHAGSYNKSYHMAIYLYIGMSCGNVSTDSIFKLIFLNVFLRQV